MSHYYEIYFLQFIYITQNHAIYNLPKTEDSRTNPNQKNGLFEVAYFENWIYIYMDNIPEHRLASLSSTPTSALYRTQQPPRLRCQHFILRRKDPNQ